MYIWRQRARKAHRQAHSEPAASRARVAVDRVFLKRLLSLVKVLVPHAFAREVWQLAALTALLMGRTILTLKIADMSPFLDFVISFRMSYIVLSREKCGVAGGASVRRFRERRRYAWRGCSSSFCCELWDQIRIVPVAAKLSVAPVPSLASALSQWNGFLPCVERGFQNRQYARPFVRPALMIAHRPRSDQRITQDTQKFADSFSALYSSIFKPVMDVILLTRRLATVVGFRGPHWLRYAFSLLINWLGPLMMYLYYLLSAILLRVIMPPFAKLTADQQKLEGDFRYAHSRLINYAEEVAFYGGNAREKNFLNSVFDKLYAHSASIFTKQASLGVFDSWLVKYGATMIGYAVVALPVFSSLGIRMYGATGPEGKSKITRDYVRNSSILINLARAIGQLILLYKTTTQLAGYTARVAELREVLIKFNRDEASASEGALSEGDNISFQDVSIVSPDNVVLLEHLNFDVNPGDNTLIVGPNGCGKSSLFRLVGGLWPIRAGRVVRPRAADMFYIPQRPYLTTGTLRQQLIYPHGEEEMKRRGVDDAALLKLLRDVEVQYLVDREGWDKELDWDETLSQGEQQRVAMARLFYHRPKYAILDECTSQLSLDIEAFLYQRCQELGITLITVAHRKSLWKYHKKILIMSGVGTYVWRDLLASEVSEESNDQGFGTPARKM